MNSKIKKIYFRFDAGGLIGFGHLGRAEAIADAFFQNGIEPIFIIRKRPCLRDVHFKYKVIFLKELVDVTSVDVITWRNISEDIEAEEVSEYLASGDLIFIDHYGLNIDFRKKLHNKSIQTISIADVTPTQINDQFLINYNPIGEDEIAYYRTLNLKTKFLLGSNYVPLKLNKREEIHNVDWSLDHLKIGIYLGGVSRELLKRFYDVVVQLSEKIRFEWIVNSDEDFSYFCKNNNKINVIFIKRTPDVVSFYRRNDLIIGACGVSFYERSFLGVPQLLVSVAENQKEICEKMVSNNLGYYIGDLRKDEIEQMTKKLANIDFEKLTAFQKKAFTLIDGNGAQNIVAAILKEV